jgi:hypothetical protein
MVMVETHIENKHSHGKGPGEITGSGIVPFPVVPAKCSYCEVEMQVREPAPLVVVCVSCEDEQRERQKLANGAREALVEQMHDEAKTDL